MSIILEVLLSCLTIFFIDKVIADSQDLPPTITTNYGKVEGKWGISYEGRKYAIFEGIPYAKPPVGDLRFEEPEPITPWTGTWKATTVNKCIQRTHSITEEPIGEEDCLYLNIYVPKVDKTSEKLDVVVHIHGGGFFMGHGSECTNEKYIMDRNIIYATMHYRLDALGFLSTEDEVVPGNNGLKDQQLAMKWIKENIDSFGGNSDSITISGFSAGAVSVHLHYFSPSSRALFHRGMSVSGSALNAFGLQEKAADRAKKFAEALGCDTSNSTIMIHCLKKRPAHLIMKTIPSLHPAPPYPYVLFAPVIEKRSKNPFLHEHPHKLLKKGNVHDVPWIASATTHEGILFSLPLFDHYDKIDKDFIRDAKFFHQFDDTLPPYKEVEITQKIRDFYFPEGETIDKSKYQQVTKMFTDRLITVDTILAAQMQSKANKSPTYFYQFGYESQYTLKNKLGKSKFEGACHGDDMPYFFGGFINKQLSDEESKLRNIALDILYSYAHTGKPSLSKITWKPVTEEFYFLNITGPNDIKLEIKTDFTAENFWQNLGLLENGNLFPAEVKTEL